MNHTAPMLTVPGPTASLATPVSAQTWLINGTPPGLAALLLVAGGLADDYGRRRIFLCGTLALGVTTALGAAAPTTLTVALARAAGGTSTAAVLASSPGLLVHAFPPGSERPVSGGVRQRRCRAGAAARGAADGLRLTAGLCGPRRHADRGRLRHPRPHRIACPRGGRPDLAGAVALGLALTALISAPAPDRDGWLRAPVGLLLLAAVALGAVFVTPKHGGSRRHAQSLTRT